MNQPVSRNNAGVITRYSNRPPARNRANFHGVSDNGQSTGHPCLVMMSPRTCTRHPTTTAGGIASRSTGRVPDRYHPTTPAADPGETPRGRFLAKGWEMEAVGERDFRASFPVVSPEGRDVAYLAGVQRQSLWIEAVSPARQPSSTGPYSRVRYEGNFEAYEENRRARLGTEADRPHRITYKKLTRT